jgi:hypothetical protein
MKRLLTPAAIAVMAFTVAALGCGTSEKTAVCSGGDSAFRPGARSSSPAASAAPAGLAPR